MSIFTETCRSSLDLVRESREPGVPSDPETRIGTALGLRSGRLPEVNGRTLQNYYRYLAANMSLPFQARHPYAAGSREETGRLGRGRRESQSPTDRRLLVLVLELGVLIRLKCAALTDLESPPRREKGGGRRMAVEKTIQLAATPIAAERDANEVSDIRRPSRS
jgi:hypothetical protein